LPFAVYHLPFANWSTDQMPASEVLFATLIEWLNKVGQKPLCRHCHCPSDDHSLSERFMAQHERSDDVDDAQLIDLSVSILYP